jgi:hypothetical protein
MNTTHLDRHRLGRQVRWLALAFFALYLSGSALGWLAAPHLTPAREGAHGVFELWLQLQNMPLGRIALLPFWQRCLGLALGLPALGVLGYALFELTAVLRSFEQAAFFTPQVSRRFRRFAAALLLGTILTMLEPTLRGLVFDWLAPAPHYRARLEFDVNASDLWTLSLCALFHAIARIIDAGQRLAAENEGFV